MKQSVLCMEFVGSGGLRAGGVVADWLVLELDEDQQAAAGIVPSSGGRPGEASRVPFAWPLSADDLEDLRWYLEDYLRAPFGVWEDRGQRIQDALLGWGDLVFCGSVHGCK